MTRILFITLILAVLVGCGIPMGNRIDAKNLQVYYLENVAKSTAITFAEFWIENGFVGERKQVIQLDKNKEGYSVKLIERSKYNQESLSIIERSQLQELEYTLEEQVFGANASIIITDNTFRPIERKD